MRKIDGFDGFYLGEDGKVYDELGEVAYESLLSFEIDMNFADDTK